MRIDRNVVGNNDICGRINEVANELKALDSTR